MRPLEVLDLGLMEYMPAWEVQKQVSEKVISGGPHTLIFVEHPLVHTLGANFHPENLLLAEERYTEMGIQICNTDRGGDITHHGPGQMVLYPIFAIEELGKDLHKWLRNLEDVVIDFCDSYGIPASRDEQGTGVWSGDAKIASIGIKVRKWVNLHGIAININNPLWPFSTIIPCGLSQPRVTSLSKRLGQEVDMDEAKARAEASFRKVFGL